MIHSILVSSNEDTGVQCIMHVDDATDEVHFENRQPIAERLELNAELRKDTPAGWKGDMHKVASIPLVVYAELQRQGITRDAAALKRWLNQSENRVFRTKEGIV